MEETKRLYASELLKPARKVKQYRTVPVSGVDDIWTADLVEYGSIANENDGVRYLLCIMDIYSRFAWVFPLKSKESGTIQKCFEEMDRLPQNLWVDQGSEFINKNFKRWCKDHGVNLYHTFGNNKAAYIERFNRTLKQKLNRFMIVENTYRYVNALDRIVNEYNNSVHRGIKQKPREVYSGNKKPAKRELGLPSEEPSFKVGDPVRISRVKNVFEKGYTPKWSKEVFVVKEVDATVTPIMYVLEDQLGEEIKGKFYTEELQLSRLKDYATISEILQRKKIKGVRMALVKYDGYEKPYWVPEADIVNLKR